MGEIRVFFVLNIKHVVTVFLLLVILGGVIYAPSLLKSSSSNNIDNITNVDCNLNLGDCTYQSSEHGLLTVSVTPKSFPALKPLSITLTTTSRLITGSTINLSGKDMFMGLNQVELLQQSDTGVWKGNITIPVCTVDADMIWLFSVMLRGPKTEELLFRIKSKH